MERILQRKIIDKETGCWNWTGGCNTKGYGQVRHNGTQSKVHRLAYQHYLGLIPEGYFVCHKCDNPKCFNPDHLFIGTALDNNRDRELKGRGVMHGVVLLKGASHMKSKLTEAEILEIRSIGSKMNMSETARQFGVSKQAIRSILHKQTWKHI